MIYSICEFIHVYFSRPTVVAADVVLFLLLVILIIQVISLKRKVNRLKEMLKTIIR